MLCSSPHIYIYGLVSAHGHTGTLPHTDLKIQGGVRTAESNPWKMGLSGTEAADKTVVKLLPGNH